MYSRLVSQHVPNPPNVQTWTLSRSPFDFMGSHVAQKKSLLQMLGSTFSQKNALPQKWFYLFYFISFAINLKIWTSRICTGKGLFAAWFLCFEYASQSPINNFNAGKIALRLASYEKGHFDATHPLASSMSAAQ